MEIELGNKASIRASVERRWVRGEYVKSETLGPCSTLTALWQLYTSGLGFLILRLHLGPIV